MDDLGFDEIVQDLKKNRIYLARVDIASVRQVIDAGGHERYREHLTDWELGYLENLKVPKRKSEFLSGRLAGKDAVQDLLGELRDESTSLPLPVPGIIEIRRTESGVPEISIDGDVPDIIISISHSGTMALSATGNRKNFKGLGIDLEMVEPRDGSFLHVAFTPREISGIWLHWNKTRGPAEEIITRHWTIKEAVLKSIGSGLNLNLKEMEILGTAGGEPEIHLKNQVLKIFHDTGGTGPYVKSYRFGNYIITVSWIT